MNETTELEMTVKRLIKDGGFVVEEKIEKMIIRFAQEEQKIRELLEERKNIELSLESLRKEQQIEAKKVKDLEDKKSSSERYIMNIEEKASKLEDDYVSKEKEIAAKIRVLEREKYNCDLKVSDTQKRVLALSSELRDLEVEVADVTEKLKGLHDREFEYESLCTMIRNMKDEHERLLVNLAQEKDHRIRMIDQEVEDYKKQRYAKLEEELKQVNEDTLIARAVALKHESAVKEKEKILDLKLLKLRGLIKEE